jgi:hypothetical protein
MNSQKGGKLPQTGPSWVSPLSQLVELGRKVMRLRAWEGAPGSWDLLHQGGEGAIGVRPPNGIRGANQGDSFARFHDFYRKHIPYNQRT